jgi:dimethylargininase
MIALTRAVSRSLQNCELTWLDREPIDIDRAIAQHHTYQACLTDLGARVISLPALEEHPDAVFVEDPALVLDELAVITTMGAASRRGERPTLAAALAEFRPVVWMHDPARLEGGDIMRAHRNLYAGISRRTDAAGVEQLQDLLAPHGYSVTAVELRNCLHLKSACSFLGNNTILINTAWVDHAPFARYRPIEVHPDEPSAANALLVGDAILMPNAFPKTAARLHASGFAVTTVDVSELMKAESGVTCSSLIFHENPSPSHNFQRPADSPTG